VSSDHPIVVTHLTKRFGNVTAVEDLSFGVRRGTVTGFLGPNGSGKSTTLRSIVGLVRPTSGVPRVLGRRYADLPNPARAVGAVLEAGTFHPRRTARNHLRILAISAGVSRARVDEVLRIVDLAPAADRFVGGFSLGMRQRLSLAGALLAEPEILLLDEPANGLDPAGMRWLRTTLRSFAAAGGTVLISSHVLAELSQIVDRVVIIAAGRLVAERSLDELTTAAIPAVRVRTPHRDAFLSHLRTEGFSVEPVLADQLLVTAATTAEVGRLAAAHSVVVLEMTDESPSLEDVFLGLTTPPTTGEPRDHSTAR